MTPGGLFDRRTLFAAALAWCSVSRAQTQAGRGQYQGQLVLEPLSEGRLMRLRNPFGYMDARGQEWAVPARAVVDGASIPRIFWTVVGGPWDGSYRNASVVHDWFCAVRTMPWKQTHRMFYEAMLTSGVDARQARLMFLAVRYAGPTWDELTLANSKILTDNGQQRLDPPGTRRVTSRFASETEAAQAKDALITRLKSMALASERENLAVEQMEELVDAQGRAETTAAMLE